MRVRETEREKERDREREREKQRERKRERERERARHRHQDRVRDGHPRGSSQGKDGLGKHENKLRFICFHFVVNGPHQRQSNPRPSMDSARPHTPSDHGHRESGGGAH